MQSKWFNIGFNISFLIVLILLLGFTNNQYHDQKCQSYHIDLLDKSNALISKGEVINILESVSDSILGTPLNKIPLYKIEKQLEKRQNIKNAEVYILENSLQIDIEQKTPVVRVKRFDNFEFYMDDNGSMFNLSENHTEHILVASGFISDSLDFTNVHKLAQFINSNPIWKSQIIQIYLNKNKEIELIPRVGNHTILFGEIDNYISKFEKLKLFYEKGAVQTGWNSYKEINLKFKDQIVCVKK